RLLHARRRRGAGPHLLHSPAAKSLTYFMFPPLSFSDHTAIRPYRCGRSIALGSGFLFPLKVPYCHEVLRNECAR
ncbi:MAG: hypothetical protein ACRDFX_08580, partial [Chloroflexota bacterium]